MTQQSLINYAAFAVLMIATALGISALWGLLFLYWVFPNFYSGHAFLITDVERDEDPILFWIVQLTWVVFGLLLLVSDVIEIML